MRADRPYLRWLAPWLAHLAAGPLGLVLHGAGEAASLPHSEPTVARPALGQEPG